MVRIHHQQAMMKRNNPCGCCSFPPPQHFITTKRTRRKQRHHGRFILLVIIAITGFINIFYNNTNNNNNNSTTIFQQLQTFASSTLPIVTLVAIGLGKDGYDYEPYPPSPSSQDATTTTTTTTSTIRVGDINNNNNNDEDDEKILQEKTSSSSTIPGRIFFTGPSRNIPPKVQEFMMKWQYLNPTMKLYFADDDDMYSFVVQHYNETVVTALREVQVPVIRSDIFRLMLIYEYGGYYSDTDVEPILPLNDFVVGGVGVRGRQQRQRGYHHHDTSSSSSSSSSSCQFYVEEMNPQCLTQFLFGAIAKHEILQIIINNALHKIIHHHPHPHHPHHHHPHHHDDGTKNKNFVVEIAGPDAFSVGIIQYINEKFHTSFPASNIYASTSTSTSTTKQQQQSFNMTKFVFENKIWLYEKANICLENVATGVGGEEEGAESSSLLLFTNTNQNQNQNHQMNRFRHHYASTNKDSIGWRSTGWTSWRADSARILNITDPELIQNGIM